MKNNDFRSVFIDNDKPELFLDNTECCPKPNPPKHEHHEYIRKNPVVNRPYSDDPIPGPFVPDYELSDPKEASPNPVPNTYLAPGHHHHNPHKHHCECSPDRNIHPIEYECCHDDNCYVTKHELNRILANIAEADIFNDLSQNGTTVSVGGVKKGTKFKKLTFSKLVKLMLYPTNNVTDQEYACKTPTDRTILNSTVKYPIGDLKVGDSLEDMTISQILEAMLCGKNKWGTYMWKSDIVTIDSGVTVLDAAKLFPQLVDDYDWKHIYELHVICKAEDKNSEDKYIYDEIIANIYNTDQITNVSIDEVPGDIKWNYDSENQKIKLHSIKDITTDIAVVLIRR